MIFASGEDMKQKKPVTREIWKIMLRRYQIAAVVGFVLCIFFFWKLDHVLPGKAPPLWVWWGTGLSGLIFFSGLFGLAISYFFQLMTTEK